LAANFMTSLALWESRRLRQAGHSDEASELLVDVMIFCGDRARGEGRREISGAARDWDRSQTELRDLLLTNTMSKAALAALQHNLQALDGTLYSYAAYLRRALPRIGEQILRDGAYHDSDEDGSQGVEPVPGQSSWKYGFSSRLTCSTAYLWIDSWVARLSDVDRLPWKTVVELRRECGEFVDSTRNPVAMKFFMAFEPETVREKRTIEARHRLLLALTGYLLTGSVPELSDPYGDKLRSREMDGVLRIWSLAMDGEDQEGEGSWEEPYRKDLPIEFRRQR
jgi:hypothetical protein